MSSKIVTISEQPSHAIFESAADDDIRLAARLQTPVLVTAQDSRERELCARLIHASGDRCRGPFVMLALDEALADRPGSAAAARALDDGAAIRHQFDEARDGTLFIDDVAILSAKGQQQLLSLLNEPSSLRSPVPTGSKGDHNARVIAGASRHLAAERSAGAFCEQLFYRLNAIHIDLMS